MADTGFELGQLGHALLAPLPVDGLAVAVLPGAPGLEEEGRHAEPVEPAPHPFGTELGAVVGAAGRGEPPLDEQSRQGGQDIVGLRARGRVLRNEVS